MGLLSGEDIVIVYSSSVKLIDKYPDILAQAVVFAVTNSGSIVDNILAAYRNNFSSKVDNLIAYAKRKPDGYYFGMPTGTLNGYTPDYENLISTIATIEGVTENEVNIYNTSEIDLSNPISDIDSLLDTLRLGTIPNVELGDLSPKAYSDAYMIKHFPGWQPGVSSPAGVIVIDGKSYKYNGYTYTTTYNQAEAKNDISNVKIHFKHDTGRQTCKDDMNGMPVCKPLIYYHTIAIGSPKGDKWYQVYYSTLDEPDVIKLFIYDTTTGKYPALKKPTKSDGQEFYPVIPIKRQFEYISGYNNKIEASVRKALDYLDFRLEDFENIIKESPDAEDLSDGFINFRVPIFTQEQKSIAYLWKFFTETSGNLPKYPISEYTYNESGGQSYLTIREDLMDYTIKFNNIQHLSIKGRIGPIGTYANSTEVNHIMLSNPNYDPDSGYSYAHRRYIYVPYIEMKQQTGDNDISVIRVINLNASSVITFEGDPYIAYPEEVNIPLMSNIMDTFNRLDKSSILLDATHITIYAAKEEHVKWYETAFFAFVFKVVAIVIVMYTSFYIPGTEAALAGEVFAFGLTQAAALLSIVTIISPGLADSLGMLGMLIGAYSFLTGGFSGVLNQLTSSVMNFAEVLMKAVNAISDFVVKQTYEDLEDITENYNDFMEEYETRLDEVNEAQQILDDMEADNHFNPLWTVGDDEGGEDSIFDVNESPDSFYNRTIHTGNPGIRTLSEPANFVSNMLRLPEFNYNDMIPAYRNPDTVFI